MLSNTLYCIIAYTYRLCANTYKLASCCTRLAEREPFPVSASARHDAYNWNIPVIPSSSRMTTIRAAAAALYLLPVEAR